MKNPPVEPVEDFESPGRILFQIADEVADRLVLHVLGDKSNSRSIVEVVWVLRDKVSDFKGFLGIIFRDILWVSDAVPAKIKDVDRVFERSLLKLMFRESSKTKPTSSNLFNPEWGRIARSKVGTEPFMRAVGRIHLMCCFRISQSMISRTVLKDTL